jgi:hypothetical protein
MNIQSLERKFQKLDEKQEEVKKHFSPIKSNLSKHPYIKDIRTDYLQDC